MDLVAGVKKVVVLMEHTAKSKTGGEEPKLLDRCTLPLTGSRVIDMVITDLGVFTIDKHAGRMTLVELAPRRRTSRRSQPRPPRIYAVSPALTGGSRRGVTARGRELDGRALQDTRAIAFGISEGVLPGKCSVRHTSLWPYPEEGRSLEKFLS